MKIFFNEHSRVLETVHKAFVTSLTGPMIVWCDQFTSPEQTGSDEEFYSFQYNTKQDRSRIVVYFPTASALFMFKLMFSEYCCE